VGEVSPINQLYEQYRDKGFEFLTVYVREPHPGENYHEHRSYEEKVEYACDCREQDGIKTRLVIDDLEGTMHRAYGEMPNMVYVIGKDGRIYYKAMWTNHEEIASVLEGLAKFDAASQSGVRRMPFYSERLSFRGGYNSGAAVDVLERAGPKARADFANAIPGPRPGA
jgi:hypothetical protein